jgi:cob(I)alamin adenosyltransferase
VWEVLEAMDLNADSETAFKQAGRYLNRLSDFLFVQARILTNDPNEAQWRGPNTPRE